MSVEAVSHTDSSGNANGDNGDLSTLGAWREELKSYESELLRAISAKMGRDAVRAAELQYNEMRIAFNELASGAGAADLVDNAEYPSIITGAYYESLPRYDVVVNLDSKLAHVVALPKVESPLAASLAAAPVVASSGPVSPSSPSSPSSPWIPVPPPASTGNGGGYGGNNGAGNNGNNGGANRPGFWRRNGLKVALGAGAVVLTVGAWLGISAADSNGAHKADAAALDAMNNMPGQMQAYDVRTDDFATNVKDMTAAGETYEGARTRLEDRQANPDGAWWNPFDSLRNQSDVMTALDPAVDQTETITAEIAQEQANLDIQNGINGVKDGLAALDPNLSDETRLNQINVLLGDLDTQNKANAGNADDAKAFLQGQIDGLHSQLAEIKSTLETQIAAEKLGVSVEDYKTYAEDAEKLGVSIEDYKTYVEDAEKLDVSIENYLSYKQAAEKTGLSIEDMIKYSKHYGVDPQNFGTIWALEQMRDEAKGHRVGEAIDAENAEDAKREFLYLSYNNPAALAQYMNALTEDTKTDAGLDGLEIPENANKLLQEYIKDGKYTDKFFADYAKFKEFMQDATIKLKDASSMLGYSYMYSDGELVVVNSAQNSNGSNEVIYVIEGITEGGVKVTMNAKNICGGQLWVGKPTPDKPTTPDKPGELKKKDQSENIIKENDKGSHDSSTDDATVSEQEATTPGGDNSSNPNAGEDNGDEKQSTDPSEGDGFDWNS